MRLKVTEEEILRGILSNNRANNNCLAFFRTITYETACIDEMKNVGYLDEKDEDKKALQELKKNLDKKLNHKNRHYFEVIP